MNRVRVSAASEEPSSEERQRFVAARDAEYSGNDGTPKSVPEAVHQDQTTLCSRCSSINVEDLFNAPRETGRAQPLMNLGKLGPKTESSPCPLCRLFFEVKIQNDDNLEDNDYILYSTDAPPPNSDSHGSVLAVARGVSKSRQGTSRAMELHTMGKLSEFIACSRKTESGTYLNSLRARTIDTSSIDFDIIRGWMRMCIGRHTKQCVQVASSASGLTNLKLIDCEQRRIIQALPSDTYSALSYVWGTNGFGNIDRSIHNRLPTSLPQTIEDALRVTKELGLRYIWIDRYCINQDDDAEKQTQIQQMDLIYQNAFITIIAAAGTDPYFGLPGIGTSRNLQRTAWIQGMCLVSILSNPQQLIRTSKWMQRARTYQESFFSTRRLVFTMQQDYFECRGAVAYETVDDFLDNFFPCMFNSASHDEHYPYPWAICSHLSAYSGRELSIEADAIRAFEGVFHNFKRKKFPVRQYLGVPIMPAVIQGQDYSLKPARRSTGEAFAAGLSWTTSAPGTRRTQFPTWSWAGWTAPFCYDNALCADGLQLENESRLKVFVENYDGSLSDMDRYDEVSLDQGLPNSSQRFVHIEAWTIPISIQYMPEGANDWIDNFRSRALWGPNISGYFAVFQDNKQNVQIPLYSLCQTYEKGTGIQREYAPDLDKDSLLGIVLGRCEDASDLESWGSIFVLIVHSKGQHFERVGSMDIGHDKLKPVRGYGDDWNPWKLSFRLKERRTVRLG